MPTVSFEKAEKVVNPPRIPVAKNSRHSGVILPLSLNPKTIPIRKQPRILTVKVPNGNVESVLVWINCESKYRNTPPMKLPEPMAKMSYISVL